MHTEKIQLKPDYEGDVIATLISSNKDIITNQAILYLHGFSDYFFQYDVAQWFEKQKIRFYALDMRKYGRSILPHQTPNDFRSIHEYFEEIGKAVEMIKADGIEELFLLGHSTGGLIAPLYIKSFPGQFKGLILNSPFFQFNIPLFLKSIFPLVSAIGQKFPHIKTSIKLPRNYGLSMHKDYKGISDYDLKLKPLRGFPIHLSWLNGIYKAQKEIRKGLDLKIPILLLHPHKSTYHKKWHEEAHTTDVILNIQDMVDHARHLGDKLTIKEIKNSKHDILISNKEVKNYALNEIYNWIREIT